MYDMRRFSGKGPLKRELTKIFMATCIVMAAAACATVPYTERQTLHLVSDREITTLSFQQYADILKKSKLSGNARDTEMVRRVGNRIATAAADFMRESGHANDIVNYRWEFNLIDDPKTVNAWCMPGGKVAVYTGLLPITKNETGLAVVMGHEIAHAMAKHGSERMSEALLVQMGGIGLSLALAEKPKATQDIYLSLYGVSSTVGFTLPYSRLHESEADRIGLMLMAKAGYDPREAVSLWKRMSAQGGGRPMELLSTHPAPESRITNIQTLIPTVMPLYEKKKTQK
jgi:predicted Zn-dependent protease